MNFQNIVYIKVRRVGGGDKFVHQVNDQFESPIETGPRLVDRSAEGFANMQDDIHG